MRYISCTVGPSHDGSPLWSALEEQLHVSRALIRRARAAGEGLLLDGKPTYTTATVHVGQTISLNVSDQTGGSAVEPQPGPVEVIYEDDDLLAVNKPAGQVVHPCPGHRSYTLGNFVLHHPAQTSSGATRSTPCTGSTWVQAGFCSTQNTPMRTNGSKPRCTARRMPALGEPISLYAAVTSTRPRESWTPPSYDPTSTTCDGRSIRKASAP